MESQILKCVLFDQDAFLDIRMLAAGRRQRQWEADYLPELSRRSQGEVLYSRNPLPKHLNRNVNISGDEEMILHTVYVMRIELLGSTQDGLYLEKGFPVISTGLDPVNETDLDILFQYGGISIEQNGKTQSCVQNDLSIEETEFPGYVKLRFPSPKRGYFSTQCLKHKLFVDLHSSDFYVSPNEYEIINESPALGGATEDELGIHFLDYVVALKMNSLPPEADSFLKRSRPFGWPSPSLAQTAIREGCWLVATGPRQRKTDTTYWRMSFAMSERRLVQSLSVVQIRGYLFFKSIAKLELWEPECLSSYMLKNVLFWTLEIVPLENWQEDNILSCIEPLVDMLCTYLDNGIIPNYFIPKQNLLASVDPDTIKTVARKSHKLQENILNTVIVHSGSPEFKGLFEVSLNELQNDMLTKSSAESERLLSMIYFSMYLYIRLQAKRYQIKLGIETLKEAIVANNRSLFSGIPPRAAWYLLEAVILNTKYFSFSVDAGLVIINTFQMRRKIVSFWRSPIYRGIFKTVLSDQEFAIRQDIHVIPEFDEFLKWVDMSCLFCSQDGIRYDNITFQLSWTE